MKLVQKILLGIGIFIGAIVLFAFLGSSGTQDAAEAVMADFHAGNIQVVYDNSVMTDDFTFEEFKTAMGIGAEYDISKAEKLSWTGRGFQNEEKYIVGNFKFGSDHEQKLTFWFLEIEDELKLLGITGGEPEDYEEDAE